jgi:glycosyltransferase involved in cell wall biosynthesis
MSYFACIIIREGEGTIRKTISSLINQTVQPRKIVVVNDGSTDSTGTIIEAFKKSHPDLIEIINTDNKTRDYTRLPRLRTQAVEYGQAHGCGDCKYFMTTGGDCDFHTDYAEKILAAMESEPNIVIASGDYGSMSSVSPHGAGRFVRTSFFSDYRKNYPLRAWQESELKMRAICGGYKTAVVKEAVFGHLDKLGHSHNFVGWGRVMKALGYSRLYVWGRFAKEILMPRRMGRRGAMRMLWTYLTYRPQESGYYSRCEPELRKAVAEMQKKMIIKILKHRLKQRFKKASASNDNASNTTLPVADAYHIGELEKC